MSATKQQGHNKFKAFTGTLGADHTLGALSETVATWVKTTNVAPKSIGVEYLEAAEQLVLTVGYRDDEPGYGIQLTSASLGKIPTLEAADLERLEGKMAAAVEGAGAILCHELYITEDHEFLMVFMTRVA